METIYLYMIGAFIVAVAIAMMVLPNILLISHKKRLFDMPDKRKVHHSPIPRLGGLAFFPVMLITMGGLVLIYHLMGLSSGSMHGEVPYEFLALLVGSMMLFLVGLADDLIGVGYKKKFLVQIVAASLLVASGVWIKSLDGLFGVYQVSPWFGMPFTVLIVVYVTNAINLIDGIDGLASGLCAISLVALAGLHIWLHLFSFALLCIAALGVIIPFWFYNVFGNAMRGRKLFMGDSGSLSLGYIISFLMIHLSTVDVHPRAVSDYNMVLAFTTMLVPLLDVVRVVGHRLRCKKNPFLPDKNHIHHKLLRCGLKVRQVMVAICVLSLMFILINVALIGDVNITYILGIDIAIWLVFHVALDVVLMKRGTKEV
jgi:UDP-GlcNAc:undecaprenyl-phosphate/decaprenyl-phosphate GlcNAc-1-phosphate transferase